MVKVSDDIMEILQPDKVLMDAIFLRKEKLEITLKAIDASIETFQECCQHDWKNVCTGPVWTHEECTICRKRREI